MLWLGFRFNIITDRPFQAASQSCVKSQFQSWRDALNTRARAERNRSGGRTKKKTLINYFFWRFEFFAAPLFNSWHARTCLRRNNRWILGTQYSIVSVPEYFLLASVSSETPMNIYLARDNPRWQVNVRAGLYLLVCVLLMLSQIFQSSPLFLQQAR